VNKRQNNKAWFFLYTLLIGGTAAILSVVSDNIRYMIGHITLSHFFISYIAITFNSLPVWLLLAMAVGRIFGKSIKNAAVYGAIYTLATITLYYVIGTLYSGISLFSSGSEGSLYVLVSWYVASVLGGILGGVTGFVFKRKPYILLIFPVGVIFQLCINGTRAWIDAISIAQSTTYCLMLVISLWYFYILKWRKEKCSV